MPLTAKGKKLKKKFREQYGDKKGDSIFYAMENSGKLKKVIKARGGKDASQADFGGGSKSGGGNGRDPSKQYTTKTDLTPEQEKTLQKQNIKARNRFIDAKYKGILDEDEDMEYIVESLRDQPEVVFMSKHGAVTFTIEDLEE